MHNQYHRRFISVYLFEQADEMRCAVDSGLCVVLIILSALMFAVGVLLFYDFENVCENGNSNITNMVNEHEPIGVPLSLI